MRSFQQNIGRMQPQTNHMLYHYQPSHQNDTTTQFGTGGHLYQHSQAIGQQIISNNNNNNNNNGSAHHLGNHHHTIDSTTLSSSHGQSKKSIDKGSDEYKKRRERNNVAVRKSREKAKMRSRETERRVAELSKENQLYRAQYEELRREFNVLKSLLLKTGLTEQVIEDEAQRHTNSMQQQMSHMSNSVHNQMVATNNQHIASSLNNHVGFKASLACNSVTNNSSNYTNTTIDTLDQWTDGINAYVEDWAA